MAIQKDITDIKGVKTRYHILREFQTDTREITAKIRSYTTKATRDAEKAVEANNTKFFAYEEKISQLQAELDKIIGDETQTEKIAQLSEELNALSLSEKRPVFQDFQETHYAEREVRLDYFEPLSIDAIYDKITAGECKCGQDFAGGVKI